MDRILSNGEALFTGNFLFSSFRKSCEWKTSGLPDGIYKTKNPNFGKYLMVLQ
jgi:hypothetical protein